MADSGHQPERMNRPAWLATVVLVGVAGLVAVWLRSGLIGAEQWPLRWLDVEGELSRTSASQIRAAVASSAGPGFFAVNLDQVRHAVESLPWVAAAEVSRHWPDALHVRVQEHRPVARWNDNGLFSDRGEVFKVNGSEGMQGLARLRGPEARRQEVLDTWQTMRRKLGEVGLDIKQLEVDERGAWRIVMDSGFTLVLGRENAFQRLDRYVAVHASLREHDRRPSRVDMRYTNGLAVRWAERQTGEQDTHG